MQVHRHIRAGGLLPDGWSTTLPKCIRQRPTHLSHAIQDRTINRRFPLLSFVILGSQSFFDGLLAANHYVFGFALEIITDQAFPAWPALAQDLRNVSGSLRENTIRVVGKDSIFPRRSDHRGFWCLLVNVMGDLCGVKTETYSFTIALEELRFHARKAGIGFVLAAPVGVILGEHRQVQPEPVFIRKDRYSIIAAKEIVGPPDLVVEILSAATSRRDRLIKAALYASSTIPCYWIVNPQERTLEEYRLEKEAHVLVKKWGESDRFEPHTFSGLAFPLSTLFDCNEMTNVNVCGAG